MAEKTAPQGRTIVGTLGDDTLTGGKGDDVLKGRAGKDVLISGGGDDKLVGGGGGDKLKGGGGADTLKGGGGEDKLLSRGGRDVLKGGGGDDTLKGGGGADRLEGGRGDDLLIGKNGKDVFAFKPGAGSDEIRGFQQGPDTIEIMRGAASFNQLDISQNGRNVLIEFAKVEIIVKGAGVTEFTEADFVFRRGQAIEKPMTDELSVAQVLSWHSDFVL